MDMLRRLRRTSQTKAASKPTDDKARATSNRDLLAFFVANNLSEPQSVDASFKSVDTQAFDREPFSEQAALYTSALLHCSSQASTDVHLIVEPQQGFDCLSIHRNQPLTFQLLSSKIEKMKGSIVQNEATSNSSEAQHLTNQTVSFAVVFVQSTLNEGNQQQLLTSFADTRGVKWLVINEFDGSLHWIERSNLQSSRLALFNEILLKINALIIDNPNTTVFEYAPLTSSDQGASRLIGNENLLDKPTFIAQFEKMVATFPDNIAVKDGNHSLTYHALNQKAQRLAEQLKRKGIHSQQKVAVIVGRTHEILVSVIACHKVNCIFVPIDFEFPLQRIKDIMAVTEPSFVLADTQENLNKIINAIDSKLESGFISDLSEKTTNETESATQETKAAVKDDCAVSDSDASHIFFTSGTTGQPKGIVLSQQSLAHYLAVAREKYRFNETQRFLAAARFTFSISFFELLLPLTTGAQVTIISRDDTLNLNRLCEHLQSVDVFHIGPSLLRALLPFIETNYPDKSCFNHIQHASSGGDVVTPDILEKLKSTFTQAEVFIIYGSSEISCMGCTFEAERGFVNHTAPVGKPFQGTEVRLLNEFSHIVPQGVKGIVHFASDGIALGYLNNRELTAEKFTQIDGKIFYTMGDVGSIDVDGNLNLHGREDFQVQIHGNRIELLEIDLVLKMLPEIQDAVSIVVEDLARKEKQITSYYSLKSEQKIEHSTIRQHLQSRLPDYMQPTHLLYLESLPYNHNGKLDRSQLLALKSP